MTTDEFFQELEKLNPTFIFLDEFSGLGEYIREKETGLCPICFLCFKKENKKYSNILADLAGNKLGLSNKQIDEIVAAADKQYVNNEILIGIRQNLMKFVKG